MLFLVVRLDDIGSLFRLSKDSLLRLRSIHTLLPMSLDEMRLKIFLNFVSPPVRISKGLNVFPYSTTMRRHTWSHSNHSKHIWNSLGFFGKFKNFGAPAPMPVPFVKRSCGDECDPRSSVFERRRDECDPRSSVFEPCGDECDPRSSVGLMSCHIRSRGGGIHGHIPNIPYILRIFGII